MLVWYSKFRKKATSTEFRISCRDAVDAVAQVVTEPQNQYHSYSLVLNRRRASCIPHNLNFPWSSCIAIMFLNKKFGMSCISPWFSTFPAYVIAGWCHCYIYGGMTSLLIYPGLWVISSAILVLRKGFRKKYSMSSNTTLLLLSTREYEGSKKNI